MDIAKENTGLFLGAEHIGIKADDLERAIKFYIDVLGFTLVKRVKPGKVELAFLKLGDLTIELVETKPGQQFSDGIVNHLALSVTDIHRAVEFLKEKRVETISEEPMPLGEGRLNFFFRGPSGEKLELFQGSFI